MKLAPVMPPETLARGVKDYVENGLTLDKLAAKHGFNHPRWRRELLKAGVKLRGTGVPRADTWREELAMIRHRRARGWSWREIGYLLKPNYTGQRVAGYAIERYSTFVARESADKLKAEAEAG